MCNVTHDVLWKVLKIFQLWNRMQCINKQFVKHFRHSSSDIILIIIHATQASTNGTMRHDFLLAKFSPWRYHYGFLILTNDYCPFLHLLPSPLDNLCFASALRRKKKKKGKKRNKIDLFYLYFLYSFMSWSYVFTCIWIIPFHTCIHTSNSSELSLFLFVKVGQLHLQKIANQLNSWLA